MFKVVKFESSGSRTVAFFTRGDEAMDYVELFASNPERWKQEYRITEDVLGLEDLVPEGA